MSIYFAWVNRGKNHLYDPDDIWDINIFNIKQLKLKKAGLFSKKNHVKLVVAKAHKLKEG